ncbi:MAG: hypothetical protein HYS98_07465 [Deltaproteobacteria bacterium]|nr:hypothetical protein [Deltaproteobacteria bacterium]
MKTKVIIFFSCMILSISLQVASAVDAGSDHDFAVNGGEMGNGSNCATTALGAEMGNGAVVVDVETDT